MAPSRIEVLEGQLSEAMDILDGLHDLLYCTQDAGPHGEGWMSDEQTELWERYEKLKNA